MLRPLLTLLLLLNYLLVVCASVAPQPGQPVAQPYDYAHRADCQLRNAWRGGVCFEDCNGVQYHVHKGHKPVPLQQVLTSLKGLDVHMPAQLAGITLAASPHGRPVSERPLPAHAALLAGFGGRDYPPPQPS